MINAILGATSRVYEKGAAVAARVGKFCSDHRQTIAKTVVAGTVIAACAAFEEGIDRGLTNVTELFCPSSSNCLPQHPWAPDLRRCPYYGREGCWDAEAVPSALKALAKEAQAYVNQMAPAMKAAAVGAGCLVGGATAKAIGKLSDWIIRPGETANAWVKAAKGAAHFPLALIANHAAVATGILAEVIPLRTLNLLRFGPLRAIAARSVISGYLHLESATLAVPLEELLFRVVLQDLILKKGGSLFLRIFSPRLAVANLNHTAAKIGRIALSSVAFSLSHLRNAPFLIDANMRFQLASTLIGGLLLGYLQEKTGDAWASLGLHAIWNAVHV